MEAYGLKSVGGGSVEEVGDEVVVEVGEVSITEPSSAASDPTTNLSSLGHVHMCLNVLITIRRPLLTLHKSY